MNLKEYISSGILEAYLLDEVTPQERIEVERMSHQHAEVRQELAHIESTLEAFALKSTIVPRNEAKGKILYAVEKSLGNRSRGKVISLEALSFWRYVAAASILFTMGASYLAYNYRQQWQQTNVALSNLIAQNQRVAEDYNVVNQKLEKIQGYLSIMESTAFRKVVLKGTADEPKALASVYWNASTEEVFLSVQYLKEISKDNQFQLWAIVNGKPVDAGVFDVDYGGLLKMKNIKGATAFAVTIEPRGGKTAPTLTTMQVVGTTG